MGRTNNAHPELTELVARVAKLETASDHYESRLSIVEACCQITESEFSTLREALNVVDSSRRVGHELMALIRAMRYSISVNSEAVLAQDGNAQELLRHMNVESAFANTFGIGSSRQDIRTDVADLREQLKRVQRSVGNLSAGTAWTSMTPAIFADASLEYKNATDQAAALAASAQAAAETAELAACAASRALEESLSLSHELHRKFDNRVDALSLAMRQQNSTIASLRRQQSDQQQEVAVVQNRLFGERQNTHESRLLILDAAAVASQAHCERLDQRLVRAETAICVTVASLNKSTRLWETRFGL